MSQRDDELILPDGRRLSFRVELTPDPNHPDQSRINIHADAPFRWSLLSGPDARRIAELQSLYFDLTFALGCCQRLAALGEDTDGIVRSALWRAALIAYRRCFTGGLRQARPAIPAESELRSSHDAYVALADGHIAHQVDRFEAFEVYAIGSPPPDDPPKFMGVHVFGLIHQIGTDEQLRRLLRLVQAVRASVGEALAREKAAAVAELSSRPPAAFVSKGTPVARPMAEIGGTTRTRSRRRRR